jgi:hypothetical protein
VRTEEAIDLAVDLEADHEAEEAVPRLHLTPLQIDSAYARYL